MNKFQETPTAFETLHCISCGLRLRLRRSLEDAAQGGQVGGGGTFGLHEVDVPGTADAQGGRDGLQAGFKTFAAERRQGGRALEDHHVRGTVVGKRARHCTGSGGRALAGRRPAPAEATSTSTSTLTSTS